MSLLISGNRSRTQQNQIRKEQDVKYKTQIQNIIPYVPLKKNTPQPQPSGSLKTNQPSLKFQNARSLQNQGDKVGSLQDKIRNFEREGESVQQDRRESPERKGNNEKEDQYDTKCGHCKVLGYHCHSQRITPSKQQRIQNKTNPQVKYQEQNPSPRNIQHQQVEYKLEDFHPRPQPAKVVKYNVKSFPNYTNRRDYLQKDKEEQMNQRISSNRKYTQSPFEQEQGQLEEYTRRSQTKLSQQFNNNFQLSSHRNTSQEKRFLKTEKQGQTISQTQYEPMVNQNTFQKSRMQKIEQRIQEAKGLLQTARGINQTSRYKDKINQQENQQTKEQPKSNKQSTNYLSPRQYQSKTQRVCTNLVDQENQFLNQQNYKLTKESPVKKLIEDERDTKQKQSTIHESQLIDDIIQDKVLQRIKSAASQINKTGSGKSFSIQKYKSETKKLLEVRLNRVNSLMNDFKADLGNF